MLKNNCVYTWREIVEAYPDLWVIITDVKENDGTIESCRLLDVCSKSDKHKYIRKYLNTNTKFKCYRTTFKAPNMGVIT